ncbi:porin [Longimicrobium sp.]|uniref:porin n=1 Tax=Longimicrobium sp. TaxID=2029185 RepID=UPI002F95454A
MPALRIRVSAIALALTFAAAPGAAQGFTIAGPDSSRLTLGGRVQTQFTTTTADQVPGAEVALRRVRLEATVQASPLVSGRISTEFAGSRVSFRDAYVRLALDPAIVILAGQTYRPFSGIAMYSSARSLPIERGVRIRGVPNAFDHYNLLVDRGYADRDVGIQLRGEPAWAPLGLSYAVGWFNGPARTEFPKENTGQVVARVGVQPIPNVRAAVSYATRDFGTVGDELVMERGDAWETDVEIGTDRRGPHLVAEVAAGDFDPFRDARFFGAQGWAGYRTGRVSQSISGVEPMLRVSYADTGVEVLGGEDVEQMGGILVTPGVNLWLGGLNRISINYDVWTPERAEAEKSLKVQFQLVF